QQPHRIDLGDAEGAVRPGLPAGGGFDHPAREAADGLQQHLHVDRRHRHVQGAGAGQHAEDGRRTHRGDRQGAELPAARACRPLGRRDDGKLPDGARRQGLAPMKNRLLGLWLGFIVLAAACGTEQPSVDTSHTITILAGSELKDLAPLLPHIKANTGYQLSFKYTGSLDGAQSIADGSDKSDLAWFSTGNYLTLLEGKTGRIIAQNPIMLSPVVIGVKHSVAQGLGWSGS